MNQILFCNLNFFIIIISSCLLFGGDCDKVDIYPPTRSEATVFTLKGKPTLYHELIDVLDYRDISSEHSYCIKKGKYDILQVKVRARSLVASKSKSNYFGFEMIQNIFTTIIDTIIIEIDTTYLTTIDTTFKIDTLKYKKKIDKKIRLKGEYERPGWSITDAGRWMNEIELDPNKKYSLQIRPLDKKDNLYFRVATELIKHNKSADKIYIKTLDNSKRYRLETNEIGKPYTFYRLSANENKSEHQFMIKGPRKVKVLTRIKDKEEKSDYSLLLKEDGLEMGSFQIKWNIESMEDPPSEEFFFRVPEGEHFYSISVADPTSMNDDIYIRLKKYK